MEEEKNKMMSTISKTFGGMSKEEKKERYFGTPPKDAYFGFNCDIKHVHDLKMSDANKRRLYGLGRGQQDTVGEVVEARLGTDSKADLIREMTENTNLTRAEAEALINKWMVANGLAEFTDPVLGKYIAPKR